MEIKIKEYSSQSSLWSSILFLCLGGILFTKADAVLDIIAIGLGIILAVIGLTSVLVYGNNTNNGLAQKSSLIFGVLLIITSIIFIFFHDIVEQFIRFIIGGWILFTGIMRLINALSFNYKEKNFLTLLLVSIVLITLGIYTIIKKNVILSTVGLMMIIYATIEILGFVFYTKNTNEKEKEGQEIMIVTEKIEEKNDKKKPKIKDVTAKETKKKNKKKNKDTEEKED